MPHKQQAGHQQACEVQQKVVSAKVNPVAGDQAPVVAIGDPGAGPLKGCSREQRGSYK